MMASMQQWWLYQPKRPHIIVSILSGICTGLFIAKIYQPMILLCLSIGIFSLVFAKKVKILYLIGTVAVGLLIGWCRGFSYAQKVSLYNAYFGRTVRVTGTVSDDPGYSDQKLVEFHVSNPTVNTQTLPGRIRIRTLGASTVGRGDEVSATGVLHQTLGTGRQGSLSYASVKILKVNSSWVEHLRKKFFAGIYSSLPEPQASLGLGYLVGVRTALPKDFALALAVVGLTHIVAVSGYNLTIIVQSVKRLFVHISAYQTVSLSFGLIAGFLVMTGWSPSIMRAAIISGFSLLAWYYGRKFQPLVLILLGAAITAFISPLYIWGDVGWYLSFLAFTGVLLIAPLVLYFMGDKLSNNLLVAILIETLAAQLLTLPYIAMIFGKVSMISPIANLLVVPFIPLAMLLVFITGLVGLISPYLALWVAVPAKLLMTFTVWVVETLSKLSWAQTDITIGPKQVVVMYIVMVGATIGGWILYHKRRSKTLQEIDWDIL